jgi:dolichyl-phosphate beta-glucosyltransferase
VKVTSVFNFDSGFFAQPLSKVQSLKPRKPGAQRADWQSARRRLNASNATKMRLTLDTGFDISIVIPTRNEEDRLGLTLDRILGFVQRQTWDCEVIVVDGASHDRTADIVRAYAQRNANVRLLQLPENRGKGFCVRTGIMNAQGRFILFTDADLSTPIEEISKLVGALEAGADIAIGSRWMRSAMQTKRQPIARQGLGRIFNLLSRVVLGLEFQDTQCGFKAFRRNAAKSIFSLQTIEQWGFDPEILFLARRSGFKVTEVPVLWSHDDRSKIHPVADGARMVRELFSIRRAALSGKYGVSFSLALPRSVRAGQVRNSEAP